MLHSAMSDFTTEILLASQPIFDAQHQLYGCELLFRSNHQLTAKEVGDDRATSEVLVNYCSGITEQSEQIQRPVFINLSANLLLSEAFFPIAPERVVLELLEGIEVTPEVLRAVQNWRKEGFRFALDDYDFDPRWDPLLPMVHYIKVDVLDADLDAILAARARVNRKGLHWVAERVETEAVFRHCLDGGFDLFQGYLLARPKPVLGKAIRSDQSSALDIVKAVNEPDIKVEKLAEVISRDPRLAMQLLRIVNSPACSLNREIQSIRETVVYLGIAQVRKWAIILSLLSASSSGPVVCRLLLIRAKTMEFLADASGEDSAMAFMTGLLSGIDLLLEIEPIVFLKQLKLAPAINQAILQRAGRLGKPLQGVLALEHDLMSDPDRLERHPSLLLGAYNRATAWSDQTLRALQ